MSSDAKEARANPLDILAKEGCKVQSLTVSDQHATLLLSHPVQIDQENDKSDADKSDEPTQTTITISSLLKLTLIPFHKALLCSNPVISSADIKMGQLPERNLLEHNPKASDEIISFLRNYNFALKSESGAEYSYYAASPSSELCNIVGSVKSPARKKANSAASDESSIDAVVSNFGAFDIELISPASAYQISRSMPSLGHVLVRETPEMYNTIVKPYIQSIVDSGSLSWIKNVSVCKT